MSVKVYSEILEKNISLLFSYFFTAKEKVFGGKYRRWSVTKAKRITRHCVTTHNSYSIDRAEYEDGIRVYGLV
jgi:hypothetical protein